MANRLNKNGTMLSQPEGQVLVDIMNDHGLEQLVNFPTREENSQDLILTSLPGQFKEVHSPDKLSDHDIVAGTLKVYIPPRKKPRRKVYLYQKGDFDSIRRDSSITKTGLYNFDPLKPHFYTVKLGFTGVYINFLISAHNIDCGYSLELPRRGISNEYPQSMLSAEI